MDFYVFECSLDSDTNIITADPDPANITPDATNKHCPGGAWTLIDQFTEGDGTYPAAKEAEIKKAIQDDGYYWVMPPGGVQMF
jgi:hypothetical protein